MIRALAILVAVLLAASVGVAATSAQMKTDPQAQPKAMDQKPGTMDQKTDQKMGQKIEGTVKAVRGNTVTLEDGTQLSIPGSVKVPLARLKPGTQIIADFEERGGQKVATSLQIKG